VIEANDEFFAPKENLLKAGAPVWIADKYTDVGNGWTAGRRGGGALPAMIGAL